MTDQVRPEDDQELFATLLGKAIRERDDEALASLISLLGAPRYVRQIKAYLTAIPGAHASTRDDVVQETFLRFMERVRSGQLLEVPPDVLKYVSRLAAYYLRDRLRYKLHEDARESRGLTQILNRVPDKSLAGPVTAIDLRYHRKIVEEALSDLDPEGRDILLLSQDHSYVEIARRIGKSKEAVRKLAKRAKARVLRALVRTSPALKEKYLEVMARRASERPAPSADELRKAVDTLPDELRAVIIALHYEKKSLDQVVRALGREKAEARRDAGYEMLSMQFGGLPFPESLNDSNAPGC